VNGISSISIRHPVPVIVLFLVLTFAGVLGYGSLRINNMPDMEFPTITVSVSQHGAAPSELETQVTEIIENAVKALAEVESVTSSISEGSSITTIEFDMNVDVDRAFNDVQKEVNSVRSSLPAGIETPVISRLEVGTNPILAYAVEAPGMSPDEISWLVDDRIGKALLQVDGVSQVSRLGGVNRAVIVDLDMDKVAAYGLTVSDVNAALSAWNTNASGGRLTIGGREQSVRTVGRVDKVEDLENMLIRAGDGSSVRLADLAAVRDMWEEPRTLARINGKETVAFQVYPAKNASQVHVADRVRERIGNLRTELDGVVITEVSSASDFVVESFHAALEALVIGALLAVVIVWFFLKDIRATLISATALPLSLIPTFAFMAWTGLSLNGITLLALSLVVGILVDDAIVEIENIVRHMRKGGMSAFEAAIEAADEIGLAVVATTMTIVAVFVPVAFMSGIPGKFFMSFGLVTCVSVLFSLLVARTLTPMMAAYLLKADANHHEEEARGKLLDFYLRLLSLALRHRGKTVVLGVAFFAGSIWLGMLLPTEFMPATDRGETSISVRLEDGASLERTDRAIMEIISRIEDHPAVESIFSTIGGGIQTGGGPQRNSRSSTSSGTVTVTLKPRAERNVTQQEFEAEIGNALASVPGARIQFSGMGYSGASVSVTLTGENSDLLAETAVNLADEMMSVSGLSNATTTAEASKPEIIVRPDNGISAELGTTVAEIAAALSLSTLGPSDSQVAKFNLGDRQVPIVTTIDTDRIADLDGIAMLPVRVGQLVLPLSAIAEISYGSGPSTIRHVEGERSVTVQADLSGITLGEAREFISRLETMKNLPDGITEREQGDSKRLRELFSSFGTAMIIGVVLMFMTLVLLFNSFLQPITILMALPLSVGGAMAFLYVTGASLAMSVLIGILLLMGIAAKNSILLVDYVIIARKDGMARQEALLDSARKRVRPIIMTSVAMSAGMLPIALGIGADAESRAPMALAVIGGLASSTALSLVFVPVVYTLMDDLEGFLARKFSRIVTGCRMHGI